MSKRKANLLLILTAVLWGSGFVAQKLGAERLSAFGFNGIRYFIGSLFIFFIGKCALPFVGKGNLLAIPAGCILFAAAGAQQLGLETSSVGNTSFITAIYIVLVPFLNGLLLKRPVRRVCYYSALLALVGLYLISTGGKGLDSVSRGDIIVLIGSFCWAFHIIMVDYAGEKGADPVRFSVGQLFVAAVLDLIIWACQGFPQAEAVPGTILPILYSGIFVIGIAFTIQSLAQKYSDPSEAAIILGLESVFGGIFGFLLLGDGFSAVQLVGAFLIAAAVYLTGR